MNMRRASVVGTYLIETPLAAGFRHYFSLFAETAWYDTTLFLENYLADTTT